MFRCSKCSNRTRIRGIDTSAWIDVCSLLLSVIEKLVTDEDFSMLTTMTDVDRFRNSIDTFKVSAHHSDEIWIKNHFGCVSSASLRQS